MSEVIFTSIGSSIRIHTAGAQASLYGSQLSHFETSWHWFHNVQDDCFVAGASWRGQL